MGTAGSTNTRAEKFIDESEYILICIHSDVREAITDHSETDLKILINELKAVTHRLKRFLKCKHLNENINQRCEALLFKYELILSEIFSLSANNSPAASNDNITIPEELYEEPEYICMRNAYSEPLYANTEDDQIDNVRQIVVEDISKLPVPQPRETLNNNYMNHEEIEDIYEVPRDLVAKIPNQPLPPQPNDICNIGQSDDQQPTTSSNYNGVDGIPTCLSILDDILNNVDTDIDDVAKINADTSSKQFLSSKIYNTASLPSSFPSYVDEIKYFWYSKSTDGIEEKLASNLDEVYAIPRRISTLSSLHNNVEEDTDNAMENREDILHRPLSEDIEKEGVVANEFSRYYTEFNDMWEQTYIEIDEAKEILSEHIIQISESHLPGNLDDSVNTKPIIHPEIKEQESIYINSLKIKDVKEPLENNKDKSTRLPIPAPREKEVIVNEIPKYFSKLNDILDKSDVNFDDAKEAFQIKKKCNEARSIFNNKVMQIVRKSEEQIVLAK